jgi:hypothetical protein
MQHTTGVAVVAAQLADTDRRALSQAWYSALHLAGRAPAAPRAPHAPTPFEPARSGARAAIRANDAPQQRTNDVARSARGTAKTARAEAGGAGPERRTPKTELARRIERGLTRRLPRAAPASFAVRGAGGRVHVLVRSDGARARVVAVCAPPLRERVERALAHARFALAGCGVRTEVA